MKLLARQGRTIVTLTELVASAAASKSVAFAVVGAGIGTGLLGKTLSSDLVVRTVCVGCAEVSCGLGRNVRIDHADEATLVRTKRLVDIV